MHYSDVKNYSGTKFKDLNSVCIQKYGNEKGILIYNKAEELFQKMKDEADYRGSGVIKAHMVGNIFPVLAYYMALIDFGYSNEAAYANTLEETQKHAIAAKTKNQKLMKIPSSYYIFKLFSKRVMRKGYPIEGWETQWVRHDSEEIHFNLKSCVYFETTRKYGHPELCPVFCANDTTSFSGYLPKIKFERSGTIAEGKEMCDFHFINTKYR